VNLAASLEGAAARDPEREALVQRDAVRLTYADLRDRAARLAGGLAGLGLGRGARLAVVLDNRHETVELYWAAQWLGAVYVPLSWRLSEDDLAYCIGDCGAALVGRMDDADVEVGGARFEELMAADPLAPAVDLDEREPSLMLYTSGTTGRPKGVPRTHRADRAGGLSQALQHGLRLGDRTLGVMPLYHTMGLHSLVAVSLVGGCFVCQPRWDPEEALGLIELERLTSLYLAPTLFHDLATHPRLREHDLSSIESISYAGAAMPTALVERCVAAFAPRIFVNHYGSTEIYTFSVHRDQAAKPGCAGRASLNAQLRLVRPEMDAQPDEPVGPGAEGQIICRMDSDEAFAGYWERPDADEKAIRGGWYFTGDVGRLDEDGDLWVVGRVDDMIVSGGENIHPFEVEDVLARHPAVSEVAVVGAPDERWGQRVVAVVVAEGVTAEELDAFCLESPLARFKRPREYRFVPELPKSASGKILRRMLRSEGVTT
jgi:2-furoate---CoA ligase